MPPVADPIDVEALLAPIPGEKPAGEDLRYVLYDQVRDARRSDDGLGGQEVKEPDWNTVVRLTQEALSARTKDLNLVCWLAEGLTAQKGFTGLQAGLRVIAGILERFWEAMYPENDTESPGEEFLARANSLEDFDRKVAFTVREIPVTRWSGPPLNTRQWEEARDYGGETRLGPLDSDTQARLLELRSKAEAEHRTSGEEFYKARQGTPKAWYAGTLAEVERCREVYSGLQAAIDAAFGRQAFGLRELEKALAAVHTVVDRTLKEKRVLEPDPIEGEGQDGTGGEAGAAGDGAESSGGGTGPVRTREDALRRLTEAADYLRRTEPQSPVPYLVFRAVAWARMPLDGWLSEVVKDSGTLESIRELLAVRPEGGGS